MRKSMVVVVYTWPMPLYYLQHLLQGLFSAFELAFKLLLHGVMASTKIFGSRIVTAAMRH